VTRQYTSTVLEPYARGVEFGEAHRDEVAKTVSDYLDLFSSIAADNPIDTESLGTQALACIDGWAPPLGQEIRGIAAGSGHSTATIATINARTEVMACLTAKAPTAPVAGRPAARECSTVVAIGADQIEPVAAQNWDWFVEMNDNWLVWTIPREAGAQTVTLTEYGIVGKIGINSAGVGVLVNILHHAADGHGGVGVPVHVVARSVLDGAADAAAALKLIGSAPVTASTALTIVAGTAAGKTAVTAEVWPGGPSFVLPSPAGLLIHTNHFLSPLPAQGDSEPTAWPDTLIRYEVLQRELHARSGSARLDEVEAALSQHIGYLCCHADLKDPPYTNYHTLATARLSFADPSLTVTAGPPCEHRVAS
jgi:isopenicillin-N N-acyltransferase like protein